MIGIEPTWVTPPDPKSGASASFATSADNNEKSANVGDFSTCAKGLMSGRQAHKIPILAIDATNQYSPGH